MAQLKDNPKFLLVYYIRKKHFCQSLHYVDKKKPAISLILQNRGLCCCFILFKYICRDVVHTPRNKFFGVGAIVLRPTVDFNSAAFKLRDILFV